LNLEKVYYQFIDEHLGKTNLTYSVIYLYALRYATDGKRIPKMGEMADELHLIPSDVHSAWLFWVSKGLASINGDEVELTLFDHDLAKAKNLDRHFASLAKSVSGELGTLSANDMDTLKYIYETIPLPPHVLIMLVRFAHRDHGKKSMNYIEKMAMDWATREINTIEKAETHINNAREGTKLKKERASKPQPIKKTGFNNFTPRPKEENCEDDLFWLEQLEKQAREG